MKITDRHLEIYVNKLYGEKIEFIKCKFNVLHANSIYYYFNIIEDELSSGEDKKLIEKVSEAKKKYKEWKAK
jgi:hypothetical protein